jgi:protein SCO1/2
MSTRIALFAAISMAASASGLCGPAAGQACPCCKEEAAAPFTKESLYQLDARFTDDAGRPFAIGSLRGRPVVLDMFFTSCGNACPITVTDMLAIQNRLSPELRSRATFVLVTFDPARDTQEVLAKYRSQRLLDGQWILLRGDEGDVRELAALLGVRYAKQADGTFSHSNILTVLNPKGEIAYQRIGLNEGIGRVCAAVNAAGGQPHS